MLLEIVAADKAIDGKNKSKPESTYNYSFFMNRSYADWQRSGDWMMRKIGELHNARKLTDQEVTNIYKRRSALITAKYKGEKTWLDKAGEFVIAPLNNGTTLDFAESTNKAVGDLKEKLGEMKDDLQNKMTGGVGMIAAVFGGLLLFILLLRR